MWKTLLGRAAMSLYHIDDSSEGEDLEQFMRYHHIVYSPPLME